MMLRGEGVKGHDANFNMNFEPFLVLVLESIDMTIIYFCHDTKGEGGGGEEGIQDLTS